jgi:RND family efflux transporter MFP subunit
MTDPHATSRPAAGPAASHPAPAGAATSHSPAGAAPPGHAEHVPVHFHHWTGTLVAIGIAVVIVGLTVAHMLRAHQAAEAQTALMSRARQAMEQGPTVNVIHVELGDPVTPLTLPGDCRAFYTAKLYGRVNGYVQMWYHDIGDHVKLGELLATIDTPELDEEIKVAEANLLSLEAKVKLAEANLTFAQVSSDRFQKAAPQGVVSQEEADQAKSQLGVGLAQVESAKAEVDLGKADLRRLQALAAFKRVVAPFDGIVTERFVDIGDLVTAGSTATTPELFTVCDSHEVRVFVDVPQVARPSIQVGMSADVTAREYPGRTFHGIVDRTSESINPASGTLRAEDLTPNADGLLVPGMFTQVTFLCKHEHPPVRIPAGALLLLADGPHAAVLGNDDCVHFAAIKIGRDLGDVIEVSEGLTGDESVILNISHDITEGQKVTPVSVTMPAKPASATGQATSAGGD